MVGLEGMEGVGRLESIRRSRSLPVGRGGDEGVVTRLPSKIHVARGMMHDAGQPPLQPSFFLAIRTAPAPLSTGKLHK